MTPSIAALASTLSRKSATTGTQRSSARPRSRAKASRRARFRPDSPIRAPPAANEAATARPALPDAPVIRTTGSGGIEVAVMSGVSAAEGRRFARVRWPLGLVPCSDAGRARRRSPGSHDTGVDDPRHRGAGRGHGHHAGAGRRPCRARGPDTSGAWPVRPRRYPPDARHRSLRAARRAARRARGGDARRPRQLRVLRRPAPDPVMALGAHLRRVRRVPRRTRGAAAGAVRRVRTGRARLDDAPRHR